MIYLQAVLALLALFFLTLFLVKRKKDSYLYFVKLFSIIGLSILSFSLIYYSYNSHFNGLSYLEYLYLSYENSLTLNIPNELKTKSITGSFVVFIQKAYSLYIVVFLFSVIKDNLKNKN